MMERVIDLSLPFADGLRGYNRAPARRILQDGYNTSNLTFYSHAGTHMDAPLHFLPDGAAIDAWDLGRCMGEAFVIDLTHIKPNEQIMPDDLASAAERITAGARVLLRTDWDLQVGDDAYYRSQFPRIAPSLAYWLADRDIALLGVETPSVASLHPDHKQELIEVHQILLGSDIVIVESLANLRAITQPTVQFIALPLRLAGVDGSPVRAIAIEADR